MALRSNNSWLGDNREEDLTERFELVHQIRNTILNHESIKRERYKIEFLQKKEVWAHLFVLSLPRLRSFLAEVQGAGSDNLVYTLNRSFKEMDALILLFRGPKEEWIKTGSISRSNAERIATAQRDVGRCAFTGYTQGEKCHILPFWTLNRPRCCDALDAAVAVYGLARIQMLKAKLVDPETNIVDTSRNMITLHPMLHKYWDRGLVGLEPVTLLYEEDKKEEPVIAGPSTLSRVASERPDEKSGAPDSSRSTRSGTSVLSDGSQITPSNKSKRTSEGKGKGKERGVELPQGIKPTKEDGERARKAIGIRVQLHWLQRTMGLTPDNIPTNLAELWRTWRGWDDDYVVHDKDARPVDDGQIVDIFDTTDAKAPDFDILKLQFDVFRMQALSGRADPVIYAPDWYYDDDGEIVPDPMPGKEEAVREHEVREAREIQEAQKAMQA
ncbi:hypothetical protein HER10_EVM0006520 [Colletotrichum scovillei]|uniref:Integral membrane protein n=1 Tax=Colletotrichum scovillei TaxID=1209932 RepID=A0A9P7R8I5_9PEZI|nr:uncharacterized protein HER10_EVM0006520 [Colletotrichum scovillei]KAF4775099.1 hypothetical protein HER10_EVM0006520 [Colletotrichum scovillei]KAG7052152.1 Integral membrane protein [Colletotrichum scovillei]KAG7071184.1 Integral membrane protein [Colletotrichum scovillei]KAG7079442.1 Integral membrane protein [Colletotrichum scovillei]